MIAFSQTLLAQQSSTAYFMQTLTQTQWLNPAVQNECKVTVGGALIPITGQLFLPIQYNYGNNGFAMNDIIQWNGDSLIRPGFEGFDTEHLYKRLRKVNYITQDFQINWLTIGYKYKDWYFGLDIILLCISSKGKLAIPISLIIFNSFCFLFIEFLFHLFNNISNNS
jgi:hypothetical protein